MLLEITVCVEKGYAFPAPAEYQFSLPRMHGIMMGCFNGAETCLGTRHSCNMSNPTATVLKDKRNLLTKQQTIIRAIV